MYRNAWLHQFPLKLIRSIALLFISFCLLPLQANAAAVTPSWQGVWDGTIGKSKVIVCLAANGNSAYRYQRYQTDILLSQHGEEWEESDHNVVTGRWSFSAIQSDSLSGVWHGTKNNNELQIQLKRIAAATDAPCNTEAYLVKSAVEKTTQSIDAKPSSTSVNNVANLHNLAIGSLSHTLAIKADGTLWAWGRNDSGQLGDGTTILRFAPVLIGHDYVSVSASLWRSFAIKKDGTLWAWGYNEDARGYGLKPVLKPVMTGRVGGGFVDISGTLGIKSDGSLWIWGNGLRNHKFQQLKIGNHFVRFTEAGLALKSDGTLWGWDPSDKRLTNISQAYLKEFFVAGCTYGIKSDQSLWAFNKWLPGDRTDCNPTKLRGDYAPIQIGEGFIKTVSDANAVYAIKRDGTLWALGSNTGGELADGTRIERLQPVKIGEGFVNIAVGFGYAAGEKSDGTLWTWGTDLQLLGYSGGTVPTLLDPIFKGFSKIFASINYTVAIKPDGTLWAWGMGNRDVSVGIDLLGDHGTKVPIKVSSDITENIYVGNSATFAIAKNGSLCQGSHRNDFLGGISKDISKIKDISVVAVDEMQNCVLVLKKDGTLWGLGKEKDPCGKLPENATGEFKKIGTGFSTVAFRNGRILGLKTDETLWYLASVEDSGAYTVDDDGQQHPDEPIHQKLVKIGAEFVAISSGGYGDHVFGIKRDGTLWGWGENANGQLGDGTTQNRDNPVKIGTDFIKVSTGNLGGAGAFTIAIKTNGTLWAWGINNNGQVGDGTNEQRNSPVQIGTGFKEISAGSDHAYAIKNDGSLWFWGHPGTGQLGLELPKVQMHQVMTGLKVPTIQSQ